MGLSKNNLGQLKILVFLESFYMFLIVRERKIEKKLQFLPENTVKY